VRHWIIMFVHLVMTKGLSQACALRQSPTEEPTASPTGYPTEEPTEVRLRHCRAATGSIRLSDSLCVSSPRPPPPRATRPSRPPTSPPR
jgi:hypothetical protein